MSKMITGLAAAAGLLFLTSPVQASTSAGDGCPPGHSGYLLWDVSAEPYHVDNMVDEHGNADGWVCAKPGKAVTDENGDPFQLYNFIDNRVVVH